MNLHTERYVTQVETWPQEGRVILAQYDDESVVVYQAYRPEIGHFAAKHGYFGGAFKLSRMSWIKPNFLWMMYRCGWASKEGQEVVLAVRLKRSAFDEILRAAVHSSYARKVYSTRAEWKRAVSSSDVRLQWDPDHSPNGTKELRRAVQLGLRGEMLRRYAKDWILEITDISEFVREQRPNAERSRWQELIMPAEKVYPVTDELVVQVLGLDDV